MKNNESSLKKLYILSIVILACMLLPIWYIGRYDVTSLDDFYFGAMTYRAWKAEGTYGAVVRAAVEQVKFYFNAKQATYSSVFLMAAYPGVWNERLYFATPFIMSSMIAGSVSALTCVLIRDVMGVKDRFRTGIICCLLVTLILETLPVPLEGIFWYNGSLHYVFMESVMIFEAAIILHGVHSSKKSTMAWTIIAASLLGFVVGGGNLVTGLSACILIGLHILIMVISCIADKGVVMENPGKGADKGKKTGFIHRLGIRGYERRHLLFLIPEAVTFICYMINITAPGNAMRQESAVQMNPVKAVILSFYYGMTHGVSWTNPMMIVIFAVVAVLLANIAARSMHRFIHPLLMALIGLCVYAAMFTPVLYAMSEDAPSRIQNIIYIAQVMIIFINLVNDLGYLYMNKDAEDGQAAGFFKLLFGITDNAQCTIALTGIVAVLVLIIFTGDKNTYTSISAMRSVLNGEASRYYAQSMERFEVYNDDSIKDVVINTYTEDARPYLLFKEDVGSIPGEQGYWQNIEISERYGKDSITVIGQ